MIYTLKVDWTGRRLAAVYTALATGVAPKPARRAAHDLQEYLTFGNEDGVTVKVNWTPEQLTAVLTALSARVIVLEQLMLRARDNDPKVPDYFDLVAEQAQVCAAARDIRDYLTSRESS